MHIELMSPEMSPDQIDIVTQDISLDLADCGEIDAAPETRGLQAGERGVATVIGGIAVNLMKSNGVTKLIEVLGAYLMQERSMSAKLTLDNGAVIEVSGSNINSDDFKATLIQAVSTAQTAG